MTPKEKAEELLLKYSILKDGNDHLIKQCALIAVDEIMKELNGYNFYYWQQVKQEIEEIMTPKEKAEQLIKQMKRIYLVHSNRGNTSKITMHFAKQCALIAVDEILNFIHTDAFSYTSEEYWQQVKQEIEKHGQKTI